MVDVLVQKDDGGIDGFFMGDGCDERFFISLLLSLPIYLYLDTEKKCGQFKTKESSCLCILKPLKSRYAHAIGST